MPNPTPIETIKSKLPAFVTIKDETYRGARYNATFIDTEYNEEFIAIPAAVIRLQHGCAARANDRRSKKQEGKGGPGKIIPLEEIKSKMPDYLEIDENSYKGIRYSARFYDKEYDVWFEGLVCNVLRYEKGYCPARREAEFKKSIAIPIEEINNRIKELYGDRITLIESTYIDTNTICFWMLDGRKVKMTPCDIFRGQFMERRKTRIWREMIFARDVCCQKCCGVTKLQTHHILTWKQNKENRFNLNNGICLCKNCHQDYHSQYKFYENADNFCDWIGTEKGQLICERLAAPPMNVTNLTRISV